MSLSRLESGFIDNGPGYWRRGLTWLLLSILIGWIGWCWLPGFFSRVHARAQLLGREKPVASVSQSPRPLAEHDAPTTSELVHAAALQLVWFSSLKPLMGLDSFDLAPTVPQIVRHAPQLKLGDKFENYALKEADGKIFQFADLLGHKPIVVEFGCLT
jgi:hypothetical protein